MRPPGCSSDRKCPLILSIHGGPHGMYGWSFNANFQVYAAQGVWRALSESTWLEWLRTKVFGWNDQRVGWRRLPRLDAGVDEALKKNSWIDPSRLGVTGGSYGGFMTNWIITQTPRFKGAVAVASLEPDCFIRRDPNLILQEFGGFPWDCSRMLWHGRRCVTVVTPTLFHSARTTPTSASRRPKRCTWR